MYSSSLNLVPEPTPSQTGDSAQSDEGTTSGINKTKEELFALARQLVAQGPASIKVAVIIQFEENEEFQEYGSPDVRNVVDEYLRHSSERILPEPQVHLTDENPELEETALSTEYPRPPKRRRYESSISPAPAELPLGEVGNHEHQSPTMTVEQYNLSLQSYLFSLLPIEPLCRTITSPQTSLTDGVMSPEDPEEETRTPPSQWHELPTWSLAELPSRGSFNSTSLNSSQVPPGELVTPWRDSGNQLGLAGSSKIIEEGVHNNRDRVSSLDDTSQSDSFLQNFQPSPPKLGQFDTVNVHEHPTSKAVFDHPAELGHGSLGNNASLMKGNTEEERVLPEHQC